MRITTTDLIVVAVAILFFWLAGRAYTGLSAERRAIYPSLATPTPAP